jgi:hypothetical protein
VGEYELRSDLYGLFGRLARLVLYKVCLYFSYRGPHNRWKHQQAHLKETEMAVDKLLREFDKARAFPPGEREVECNPGKTSGTRAALKNRLGESVKVLESKLKGFSARAK